MFLRRLFYASATILLLGLGYHLGGQPASAQSSSWRIAGDYVVSGGTLYTFIWDAGWRAISPSALPVSASDIAVAYAGTYPYYLSRPDAVITTTGELWTFNLSYWVSHGPVPGDPTATPSQSWGSLKVRYR